jgi:hypothetical protein
MDAEPRQHVTLTGDFAGEYVVLEKRSDGSLVLSPDPSRRSKPPARRPADRGGAGSLLAGLLSRPPTAPPNVPEILDGWGVELADDEGISEFLIADVDGKTGFLAITTQRFIFAAQSGKGLGVVQEHLLSAARNVEVVGRRRRPKLRVTWHGSESVIGILDRDATSRLQETLSSRSVS